MKLIKPYFEIIEQGSGYEGILKHIELCGRVAYKSEDKITGDSAKAFVDRMIKSGHGSTLEHGTVYLTIPITDSTSYRIDSYIRNNYTRSVISKNLRNYYITTNLRVLVENNWLNDLQYICEPTEYHTKRYTVKFVLSRSTAQQFTRHRLFSVTMESQRYCNYSLDKFSKNITYIIPPFLNLEEGYYVLWDDDWMVKDTIDDFSNMRIMAQLITNNSTVEYEFLDSLYEDELTYLSMINKGCKPQEAREVLPNATKTELILTGFKDTWEKFFLLRCEGADPKAMELAVPLKEEFIKRSYL